MHGNQNTGFQLINTRLIARVSNCRNAFVAEVLELMRRTHTL